MNELVYVKDETLKDLLKTKDGRHQVMMEWEKPYMEALVKKLNPSGDVLEIGFGLGYSADAIQQYDINSHTIIECDPVVLEKAYEWAKKQKRKVTIVDGTWQEKLGELGRFDSFFFDDYPYPVVDVINDRHFNFYYRIALKHTNKNARLTWYCDGIGNFLCNNYMTWDCDTYAIDVPENCEYLKRREQYKHLDIMVFLPLITFKQINLKLRVDHYPVLITRHNNMYGLKKKQLTASGQVTTKVTSGTNTLSAPARVVQLSIRRGGTLGRIDLIDNGASGTVKYTIPTPAIGAGEDEIMTITFPDPGMRFETDLYVFMNQATHVEVLYA